MVLRISIACFEIQVEKSKRQLEELGAWGETGLQMKFRKSEYHDWHGTAQDHLEKELRQRRAVERGKRREKKEEKKGKKGVN